MADFTFNCAKGRTVELTERVRLGDPAAARLYVIPVAAGSATDTTLRRLATYAAVVAAGVTELTTGGWSRKTIAAADLTAITPDNTNDRQAADLPDQTWAAVATGASTDLIICYASVATPTDAQLVPLTQHDFVVATPTGGPVTAQVSDFFRAS